MGGVSFEDIARQYFSRETITFELRLLCRKIEILENPAAFVCHMLVFLENEEQRGANERWAGPRHGWIAQDTGAQGMVELLRTQGPRHGWIASGHAWLLELGTRVSFWS